VLEKDERNTLILSKTTISETDASAIHELGRCCLMSVVGHDDFLYVANILRIRVHDGCTIPAQASERTFVTFRFWLCSHESSLRRKEKIIGDIRLEKYLLPGGRFERNGSG
jgi:hypothetical protein